MLLSPLADLDLADLDRMHRVNIRGTFVVNQQAARRIRSGGAIINFSSTVVNLALPHLCRVRRHEGRGRCRQPDPRQLRGRDITVNAVAPGPTATPLFLDGKDQTTIDHMASQNPLSRLGAPSDIAELVAFPAGPGRLVNGQTIDANGGIV